MAKKATGKKKPKAMAGEAFYPPRPGLKKPVHPRPPRPVPEEPRDE